MKWAEGAAEEGHLRTDFVKRQKEARHRVLQLCYLMRGEGSELAAKWRHNRAGGQMGSQSRRGDGELSLCEAE